MTNYDQFDILNQGVDVWNKWREENPKIQTDFIEAQLTSTNLKNVNFSNTYLQKAQLTACNLNEANLFKADLREAKLSEANLDKANLSQAGLPGAFLMQATLIGANLNNAYLPNAILVKANLSGANLSGANLRRIDFTLVNLGENELNRANFSKADLTGADLAGADLSGADFSRADLTGARLREANLRRVNLSGANLTGADLSGADLTGADLRRASINFADLTEANLTGADLRGADLRGANLILANVSDSVISESKIYGVNVWDLVGEFKEQNELIITPLDESIITVDNIKVAQFIYLILNNKEIREVINTLTSKTVLILGRFSIPERKTILDALRNKLREYDLLPIVFDFDRPADKDFTETIKTLAGISFFVIADVTNPKSSPLELQATVPDYQIPFVPIIQEGESPFAMMVDLQKKYSWVLDTISYDTLDTLIKILKPHIIDPAIKKHDELRIIKATEPTIISGKDLLSKI